MEEKALLGTALVSAVVTQRGGCGSEAQVSFCGCSNKLLGEKLVLPQWHWLDRRDVLLRRCPDTVMLQMHEEGTSFCGAVLLQWHQQVTGERASSAVVWTLWRSGSRREGESLLCLLCSSALGGRREDGSALVLLLRWQGGEQLCSGIGEAQFVHKPHCNSSRILNSSPSLCCCLLGNLEEGGNFPSVHATGLNGPLYCWNSVAPLARQAGDTYFLGDISQTSFILGWRMSVLCFLKELGLLPGTEAGCSCCIIKQ